MDQMMDLILNQYIPFSCRCNIYLLFFICVIYTVKDTQCLFSSLLIDIKD